VEMLNPQMKSWGIYELYRQQAEQLRAEKEQDGARPQPAKTNWAPGSVEWQAEKDKSS
jgi:hypothetical protein